jgi:DNA-binding response OmpR family regulator
VTTILVVDDDPWLLEMVGDVLARERYRVLRASSGEAALRVAEQHVGSIDLLLADVVMPGMSGRELADRLRPLRPNVKVIYMSAFSAEVMGEHGVLDANAPFVSKPFTTDFLVQTVRRILGSEGPSRRPGV